MVEDNTHQQQQLERRRRVFVPARRGWLRVKRGKYKNKTTGLLFLAGRRNIGQRLALIRIIKPRSCCRNRRSFGRSGY
jgi:hypothetical protein